MKDVSKRFAQFIRVCAEPNSVEMNIAQLEVILENRTEISDSMKGCILIAARNGLRVSEMLLLGGNKVLSNGNFYITAPKNKKTIVINTSTAGQYESAFISLGYNIGSLVDRFYMYRLYKSLGISYHKAGNKNNSVTHAFRHLIAKEIRDKKLSEIAITESLHHKSAKSSESYGR